MDLGQVEIKNIYTSYFSKHGENPNAVSIAGKPPYWYKGRQYKKLAPNFWFFKKYKEDGNVEFYTECYYKEILDKLNPLDVLKELGDGSILLCYEMPDKFCHRKLVAEWLYVKTGILIKELN